MWRSTVDLPALRKLTHTQDACLITNYPSYTHSFIHTGFNDFVFALSRAWIIFGDQSPFYKKDFVWARPDSNQRSSRCKRDVLTTRPRARRGWKQAPICMRLFQSVYGTYALIYLRPWNISALILMDISMIKELMGNNEKAASLAADGFFLSSVMFISKAPSA